MPRPARTVPELLAPAGSPEALRAAVANGADAVYLGVDRFNARRGAPNFTLDSLPRAVEEAHLGGTRVYLTLNVLILQAEMGEALEIADRAWASGVDALIVQDLGLLRALRSELPHVRVHASTQLNCHNTPTAVELGALGVSRVTLAREVSVPEIARITSGSTVEIESFVHGALCMCYSGQCLLSSLVGGRSANRGQCAQPCRLPYELVSESGRVLETPGAYLLSPRDLAGLAILPRLADSGLAALKIEGRMKSPEYVALVTGVYRSAMDRLAENPEAFEVRDGELSVLAEAFNRGFSEAYLAGVRDNEMMSYRRPNNRGVFLGRVVSGGARGATVALETSLDADDTVEFWTSAGRFAQRAGELTVSGRPTSHAPAGKQAALAVDAAVAAGDRVFRVSNASLLEAARRTYSDGSGRKTPLEFDVRVVVDEPLLVTVTDDSGRSGAAMGAVVERARTKAITAEEVREHVGRLGGTRYEPRSWDVAISPNAGLGFSQLHSVRRDALAAYERGLLAAWADRQQVSPRPPRLGQRAGREPARRRVELEVATDSLRSAEVALQAGAAAAHVPVWALAGSVPPGVVPVVPRILHDREVTPSLESASADRTVVGNLGVLRTLAEKGSCVDAHWSLNAVNPWAVAELESLGASRVWLSPELSAGQAADIAVGTRIALGTAVYGRQELMVTEHCILMAQGECNRDCADCARRAERHYLKDRKGYTFPVTTDPRGRSHVYNSVRLDLTTSLPEILVPGIDRVRLDLVDEDEATVNAAVEHFLAALDAAVGGRAFDEPFAHPHTTGHTFRGVR